MTTLSEMLQSMMQRARIGTLTLSKLTGIPRTSIENWREGTSQRPRHWRPLLQIARVLMLDATETEVLLAAAGYPGLATLDRDLRVDDPDWPYLQPWLSAPTARAVPSLTSACHQLRPPIADFVGRDAEIDQLVTSLRTALLEGRGAIISGVLGMGGIGKTELAYVVAHRLHDVFPDAQIVLNLRGTSIAPLAPPQALQAVIHTFAPDAKLTDDLDLLQQHYQSILHGRRVLLLADDARDAAQVRPLLPPTSCALLITSRTRFTLPGMTTINLEQLPSQAASTLLRTICLRLSEAEAQALARTCGYLPLALRVTGGLLHTTPALTITDYLTKLADTQQRLSLLRDPDDSQLDVAASLALSYAQLDPATQQLFRQLGVFVADFPTALAQDVVEISGEEDVEALLHVLLRRNLVMYDPERARWRLHDLVRNLAEQRLEAMGEAEAAQWRYARAAVALAVQTQEQYLAGGEATLRALSQFDAERQHIDAAYHWARLHVKTPTGDQMLLDIAWATRYIQQLRYDPRYEYIPLWEGVRAAAQRLGNQAKEAYALGYLGNIYCSLGESHTAFSYYEQAFAIAHEFGHREAEAAALGSLGIAYTELGEPSKAISYHEQALVTFRKLGYRRGEADALTHLGVAYYNLSDLPRAISYYEQALTIVHKLGDHYRENQVLVNLGNAYTDLGNMQRAINSYIAALTISRAIGDRRGEAECQLLFSLALAQHGDRERALPLLRAALAYEQEIGHAKAAEHTTLVTRLEAGEGLPVGHAVPLAQRALGDDADESTENDVPP